jgi:hypothetical protein
VLPRPRVRIPLWSAVAIVAAAYLVRSFVRGSLRLDLPLDAVVVVALIIVVGIVAFVRHEDHGDADAGPAPDTGPAATSGADRANVASEEAPDPADMPRESSAHSADS